MLPGGPAGKAGIRYECLWAVRQVIDVLHGFADSIRIEPPGEDKAEFVVERKGSKEFHQAKRQRADDDRWTLRNLGSAKYGVLQYFKEKAKQGYSCVFVSTSDAQELRELADSARSAASVAEFAKYFLNTESKLTSFRTLKEFWSPCSDAEAFDLLKRIRVDVVADRTLEDLLLDCLRPLFESNPQATLEQLVGFVLKNIHQTITATTVQAFLSETGTSQRSIPTKIDLSALISNVTESYLNPLRARLIQKKPIPRDEAGQVLQKLASALNGVDLLITSAAGGGKTGCVLQIVDELRNRGVSVLAFRLDRLPPSATTLSLGQQLGLPESPVLVLANSAHGKEAALVIDQLDAVSTTSGRHTDFFATVEALLSEVRGLRSTCKLHVILACRKFDWQNDHRFKVILPEGQSPVEVTPLAADAVKHILAGSNFVPAQFNSRQIELLRLPQNLALFLASNNQPAQKPQFANAKDLFDAYWNHKRQEVNRRAAPAIDQWLQIIGRLCDEMSRTQQLSVPRELLDAFSPDYVSQMASEGVLTFEGGRYGFGHESFFDYCFARTFFAGKQTLVAFLEGDEQHLFRRAQVRQILSYQRDDARAEYSKSIAALIASPRIRGHLKQVVLTLLNSFTEPGEDEFEALRPFLESEIQAIRQGNRNTNRVATLVWRHFFIAPSWFRLADRHGWIKRWLESGEQALENLAANYLRAHQKEFGDRVAELLEPFVGRDGDWKLRLRYVMEWASLEKSRRFFELLLRLVDDGTLDDARDRLASNGTFWSMIHGLEDNQPGWMAELAAHWLRRRFKISRTSDEDPLSRRELLNDDFGTRQILQAAQKAPREFVQHVLPAMLEVVAATAYNVEYPPAGDPIWSFRLLSDHLSLSDAYLNGVRDGLSWLMANEPDLARPYLDQLKASQTDTANFILLSALHAGGASYADEAVTLLCEQPFRCDCGFSSSPFWTAAGLLREATKHCTDDNLHRLEKVLLEYATPYERSKEGYKQRGRSQFTLLSAVDESRRSAEVKRRLAELEQKFRAPDEPPQVSRVYTVVSPISDEAGKKMTDEQWLSAIAKYDSQERIRDWQHPERGGAWELSRMLQGFVKEQPQRFADLCIRFPKTTHRSYFAAVLNGLKDAGAPTALKLQICRWVYSLDDKPCGRDIVDTLATIKDEELQDDLVNMISWFATSDPDPEKELWRKDETNPVEYYGGEILSHGINTVRGRAAEAIRDLIFHDASYVAKFRTTLEAIVSDKSIAVRSCVASTIVAVAVHNQELAVELFSRLIQTDDALLATRDCERFINSGIRRYFDKLLPAIERMIASSDDEVREAGGRQACIAALTHEGASSLAESVLNGDEALRKGAAQIAEHNIAVAECHQWCEQTLLRLFNDDSPKVRSEVARCFRSIEAAPLEEYAALIAGFIDSKAFESDSSSLLYTLNHSQRRIPAITCEVCERFLQRFADEAKDIRTGRAADSHYLADLVFRTYAQHEEPEWRQRCLAVIDEMCLEGIYDVIGGLESFER
jgi:hypothetical protein